MILPFSKIMRNGCFQRMSYLSFSIINLLNLVLFQKNAMEDSVEIIIEKLLHVTKDDVAKVTSAWPKILSILKLFISLFA